MMPPAAPSCQGGSYPFTPGRDDPRRVVPRGRMGSVALSVWRQTSRSAGATGRPGGLPPPITLHVGSALLPQAVPALEGVLIVAQVHVRRQFLELLGVAAPDDDIVRHQGSLEAI